jgi:hypothetical protein
MAIAVGPLAGGSPVGVPVLDAVVLVSPPPPTTVVAQPLVVIASVVRAKNQRFMDDLFLKKGSRYGVWASGGRGEIT